MLLRPIGILLAAAAAIAQPQPTASASLQFEVASVKPSTPKSVRGSEGGPGSKDPTHFRFQAATLDDLIAIGYHVNYFQISSKAALDRDRFDVEVKVPEHATRDEYRQMMRNLLQERFHLRAHVESREFAGYELVVAKTGLKMKEHATGVDPPPQNTRRPAGDDGFPDLPAGRPGLISRYTMSGGFQLVRSRGQQESISVIAQSLRAPDDAPIVDKTGLTGKYDFTLEYTTDVPGGAHDGEAPVAPGLFTALQQQLGLQLIARKLPFDVVVVEAFERTPTEN